MSLRASIVDRTRDGGHPAATTGEAFAFAPPDSVWAPLTGERPRAAGRLLAFVAGTGVSLGLGLWIVGELAAAATRGLF